jgi:hypothetical protein
LKKVDLLLRLYRVTPEGESTGKVKLVGRFRPRRTPTTSISESLNAETVTAQRREHENAANAIRRNEVKIRKALSSVASLPAVAQS